MKMRSPLPWTHGGLIVALVIVATPLASPRAVAQKDDLRKPATEICESFRVTPRSKEESSSAEPVAADPVAFTLIDELVLGHRFVTKFEAEHEISSSNRLEKIGTKVARACDRPLDFTFRVVNDEGVYNAFSLPGGHVYVTAELLKPGAFTDDELAFVLGHEIAHAALRHVVEGMLDEGIANYVTSVLCKQLNQSKKPDAKSLVITYDALRADMSITNQHRELAADQFGSLYAVRARYKLQGGITGLEKLAKGNSKMESFGNRPNGMPTHPPVEMRVAEIHKGAAQLQQVAVNFEKGHGALKKGYFDDALSVFKDILLVLPESQNARLNYGTALHGKFRALQGMSAPVPTLLLEKDLEPDWTVSTRRRGTSVDGALFLERAQGQYAEVLEFDPENHRALNNLGAAYLDQERLDDAIAQLELASRAGNPSPVTFKNLGIACHEKSSVSHGAEALHRARQSQESLTRYLGERPDDDEAWAILEMVEKMLSAPAAP